MKQARSNKSRRTVRRHTAAVKPVSGLLIPLLLVIVAVAVALVFIFVQQETKVPLEQPTYQYFMLNKQDYGQDTVVLTGENNIVFQENDSRNDGDVTPLYYTDTTSFLVPQDMAWSSPYGSGEWLIPAYSRIERDENQALWCVINDKRASLNGGLLSDGRGTYVFLDKMVLSVNGREQALSPFSFYSTAQGMCRVYDYDTDSIVSETLSDHATVTAPTGYQINLSAGIFQSPDGSFRLLSASPSVLPQLKIY